jgi:DNA (cytosine-5)-methyltransferase 1
MVKEYTVISIFAGCGGSSLGYKLAGLKELLAIDFDKNAVETFRLNFDCPIWNRDIKGVLVEEILSFIKLKPGDLDILDGSPPCQGFSIAGKMQVRDDRNQLFREFKRLIGGLQPKVFVMENVPGMMKGRMKGMFNEILSELKSLNYQVKCKLMNAKYYEVPQSRERLIFIGVRNDLKMSPVYPISKNKILGAREIKKAKKTGSYGLCYYLKGKTSEIMKRIKKGQRADKVMDGYYTMSRTHPDRPTHTICKSSPWLIHYDEDRILTVGEMLIIASFPRDFKLYGETANKLYEVIGNAVPPMMMYHIAMTIKEEILMKVQ